MICVPLRVHLPVDQDPSTTGAMLLACLLLLVANAGHAQHGPAQGATREAEAPFASDFTIDDRDPEQSIPSEAERSAKPIDFGNYLMLLTSKAEEAAKRGDHLSEAKYYGALAKAVPDSSIAFSKGCAAYEAAGMRDEAEQSCAQALSRSGVTVADFVHFVRIVLSQRGSLGKAQVADADAAIAHLEAAAPKLTIGAELACDLGARLNDGKRLSRCTAALHKLAPNDLKTISYEWAFAMGRGDLADAKRGIERARRFGMRPEGIARMEQAVRAAAPSPWRVLREKRTAVLLATAGVLALGFALSVALRRRRSLRQVSA
jgi:hypothetical protein